MIERLLAADAALARDQVDVAQRLFAQVADADPRNAMAVVGLARVAIRSNAPGLARTLALRALGIDPEEAAARRLIDELDAAGHAVAEKASVVAEKASRVAEAPVAEVSVKPTMTRRPAPWWRRILARFI